LTKLKVSQEHGRSSVPKSSVTLPVRQRGSHVFMRNPDGRRAVVPIHESTN